MPQLYFFAPLHERFLSFLIDQVVLYLLVAGCVVVMQFNEEHMGQILAVNFFIAMLYYAYFQSGKWQASPGMRVLGLRLMKIGKQNGGIKPADAVLRYIALVLPSLPIYTTVIPKDFAATLVVWLGIIWYGMAVFRPDRAAMHDLLSNMRVVRGKTDV